MREEANAAGTHWRLRRPLAAICPRLGLAGRRAGNPRPGTLFATPLPEHRELLALAEHSPGRALYLDLETCGFAGSMIFLVGLVWSDGGQLWLDQLLARNYAEERAVLATLWQIAAPQRVLVTFNGKSFDWPMVKDRSTLHRLKQLTVSGTRPAAGRGAAATDQLVHCDLLHHARRRWREHLPDCRLQTLERIICRRQRRGDVAGAEVPRTYHDFVRSGELRRIEPVLHHNALDLATLVEIGQVLVGSAGRRAESA